ncbi:MAG: RNA 2',3'-cyclic phosphodiesterase [Candidatus Thermoplasmatota archaeon]|nr:RNA 2',3'-cyclic phosphodiesterase [Candidatus Thermoplasmatota archaeon]MCL5983791.1 RNA 2',3'-cyclic phosphodiesterase [Candidatus Thermoplasmatota archaeon]
MRLFFAVDVPPLPPWDPGSRSATSAAPEHITVRFLGDVPAERCADLNRAGSEAVAGLRRFPIELASIGAFPSERSPRIVYVTANSGTADLEALAARLTEALARIGIPPDPRPFAAHVTWRRIRSAHDQSVARVRLAEGTLGHPIVTVVRALLLKESELSSAGAVHRVIAEFPLGAAPNP